MKLLIEWEKHTTHVSCDNSSVIWRKQLFQNALYVFPLLSSHCYLTFSSLHAGVSITVDEEPAASWDYAAIFARNCGKTIGTN